RLRASWQDTLGTPDLDLAAVHPALCPSPGPVPSYPMQRQYLMADHGLFVAGILHTIAPDAALGMIRVLNDYGAGYLTSLIRGLQRLDLVSARPLVVNLSLTVHVPVQADLPALWSLLPEPDRTALMTAFGSPVQASQSLYDIMLRLSSARG